MSFFCSLRSVVALILAGGTMPALAADHVIDSTRFRSGALRLEHSWMGQGAKGSNELHRLYESGQWRELVDQIVAKRYPNNLYYFYLGRAAEKLGHTQAALIYYGLATREAVYQWPCGGFMFSCQGIVLPRDAAAAFTHLRDTVVQDYTARVRVSSRSGGPVPDALVRLNPYQAGRECVTDATGTCAVTVATTFSAPFIANVVKPGWFPARVKIDFAQAAHAATLTDYKYYYCPGLRGGPDQGLPDRLGQFAAEVFVAAGMEHAELDEGGICTSDFKQKKYIAIRVAHHTTFNANKLNNYAIAVEVFDSVVRKLLAPLAAERSALGFDGFDIVVATGKKSLGDAGAALTGLTYRFYLPTATVQQYRDKDITGQQLVDASIVLLNDERIDLKLQ